MRRNPNGGIRHNEGEYNPRHGLLRFLLSVMIVTAAIVGAVHTGFIGGIADALGNSMEQPGPSTESPRPKTNTSEDWRLSIDRDLEVQYSEKSHRDWRLVWSIQVEVLAVINAQRKNRDIEPLYWNGDLSELNRWHAQNVHRYNNTVHINRQTGRDWSNRADWAGYNTERCTRYSEVITTTGVANKQIYKEELQAKSIVRGWMYSWAHRKVILNETYDVAGVGIFVSDADQEEDGTSSMYAVMTLCDRRYIPDDELNGWEDARWQNGSIAVPYEKAVAEAPPPDNETLTPRETPTENES